MLETTIEPGTTSPKTHLFREYQTSTTLLFTRTRTKGKKGERVNEGASAIAFQGEQKMRYAGEGERENEKPQDIATGAHWQNRGSPRRLELVQGHHAHRDIGVLDHFTEFLKADLAIQILVRLHHGLIHNLKAKIVRRILAASPFGIDSFGF